MTRPTRILILGAAGRDFHNFNRVYRDDPGVEVVAFTAAQIPGIAGRRYPPELAGPHYPAAPMADRVTVRMTAEAVQARKEEEAAAAKAAKALKANKG